MNYISVFSGIEAATAAWKHMNWKCLALAEIEKFPSAVLAHHYPDVPNLGDINNFKQWGTYEPDLLVGGSPCQSFSVAGLRKGLDDPRGNLALVYLALAERFHPRWVLWENVPGVLSSRRGRDFGSFLGALGQLGYGWAYRILDAQYYGVPQRRRRVFIVGYLGDWRRAAAVLFERHSLSGDSPPSREKGKGVAGNVAACLRSGGDGGVPSSRGENCVVSMCLNAKGGSGRMDAESETFVLHHTTDQGFWREGLGTLRAREQDSHENLVTFSCHARPDEMKFSCTITTALTCSQQLAVLKKSQVRRLTPKECERLQGFPDNYTQIPWRKKTPENCPDGPRYRALGNSMAVPCMRWLGERINFVNNQTKSIDKTVGK